MNTKFIQHSMTLFIIFMLVFAIPVEAANAAPHATLEASSSTLKARLKSIGYFNKDVTAYFSTTTLESLKRLQKIYGEPADAVGVTSTLKEIKSVSVNKVELELLARIIYAEARGESYKGQVGVAAVVLNRLESSGFPDTVKEVIEQPRAFTAVDDGQYKLKPDKKAYQAAQDALEGYDPTSGALYYFNPKTATSSWIWTREQTVKIGRHVFAV